MKIEVGKTYKTTDGRSVFIEHRLSRNMGQFIKGMFIGIYEQSGGFDVFKENGDTWNESNRYQQPLVPNKVKKEGWIAIYKAPDYFDGDRRAANASIYKTKQDASLKCPAAITIASVVWEEDE